MVLRKGNVALVLVTLIPLAWLLTVTVSAGLEKICSHDPRIGFLAQAKLLKAKIDAGVAMEKAAAPAVGAEDPRKKCRLQCRTSWNATLRQSGRSAAPAPRHQGLYWRSTANSSGVGAITALNVLGFLL